MEPVYDLDGVGKTTQGYATHASGHVQCDRTHFQAFFKWYPFKAGLRVLRSFPFDHGYEGAFAPVPVLVADIRVKLVVTQARLVKGNMPVDVFREEDILFRMWILFPGAETAQMVRIIK